MAPYYHHTLYSILSTVYRYFAKTRDRLFYTFLGGTGRRRLREMYFALLESRGTHAWLKTPINLVLLPYQEDGGGGGGGGGHTLQCGAE